MVRTRVRLREREARQDRQQQLPERGGIVGIRGALQNRVKPRLKISEEDKSTGRPPAWVVRLCKNQDQNFTQRPEIIGFLSKRRETPLVSADASLATVGITKYLSFANPRTAGLVERHKHPGWGGHWDRPRKLITAVPIVSPPNPWEPRPKNL